MKGDFSRVTFDPYKDYSRVLMQQGRVLLDADWNEQAALFQYYMRNFIMDLIGPYGTPCEGPGAKGFLIEPQDEIFTIGNGRYYVDGILCDNSARPCEAEEPDPMRYDEQPGYPFPDCADIEENGNYLVYLDVWERHITYLEDKEIREVALNGLDTTTRAKIVWQVKVAGQGPEGDIPAQCVDHEKWFKWVELWQSCERVKLKARTRSNDVQYTDPCLAPPEAGYRGTENQLYRVEIHYEEDVEGGPTFKWSRDNGSNVFPVDLKIQPTISVLEDTATVEMTLVVKSLGRDIKSDLQQGDWVELVHEDNVLRGTAEPLWQVKDIDRDSLQLILARQKTSKDTANSKASDWRNPLLRRWDQKDDSSDESPALKDGTAPILEGAGSENWILLEDGIWIQFQKPAEPVTPPVGLGQQKQQTTEEDKKKRYRTGDYWLIPARVATGDIIWPENDEALPLASLPHGIDHHYAPLAIMSLGNLEDDCRKYFTAAVGPAFGNDG